MVLKSLTAGVVSLSLIAGSMIPLAGAAMADGWGDRGHHAYRNADNRNWNARGDRRFRGFQQYRAPRHDYRDYRAERRDRRDGKVARGVALGIGVLMLGAILSQAGNHDRYGH